jgi:hypothetical protein
MSVNAALVGVAAAVTLLLPRRTAGRHPAAQVLAGQAVAATAREQVSAAAGQAPADVAG